MMSLKDKVAIITGVSRRNGIGFGISRHLASQGANLFLHSYTPYDRMMELNLEPNEAELILEELEANPVAVEQMEADFEKADTPGKLIKRALKRFGRVDILIINHTYDTLKTLDELDAEEIDRIF